MFFFALSGMSFIVLFGALFLDYINYNAGYNVVGQTVDIIGIAFLVVLAIAAVVAIGTVLMYAYLLITGSQWFYDLEYNYKKRKAEKKQLEQQKSIDMHNNTF